MQWQEALFKNEARIKQFNSILDIVEKSGEYFPTRENILKAFEESPFEKTKVLWLGQDPYHDGKATGISMGVVSASIPPTLRVLNGSLLEEYEREITDYSLVKWANQGVLLLNAALTVNRGKPGSHAELWKEYMFKLLLNIHELKDDLIWVILGANAKKVIAPIPGIKPENLIIAPHPMVAVYAGDIKKFTSHKVFTQINSKLKEKGLEEILF